MSAPGLRERGKQERAARILTAARELLREQSSPSMEAIARRAGVAPATVFNLVGTRERVWAALADEALAEADRLLDDAPPAAPRAAAHRIVITVTRVLCSDADVYRAVLSHWNASGRLLTRDPTADLQACLERAVADGELRPDADARELARLVSAGCTGALHQWAAGMLGDEALARRCRRFVDLAFDAARV